MDQWPPNLPGYEILAELGRGTTGVVFKAQHTTLNRLVALKVPVLGSRSEASLRVSRFHREAVVLASLSGQSNPHMAQLYEVGEYQEQPYYVREFVEGSTLERLAMAGMLTMRDGVKVLAEIGRAVARLHEHGIAHRNLDPSNVLVVPGAMPKLIGFGVVGFLAESNTLPLGAVGVSADVDVRALQQLLCWLSAALDQPLPASLEVIRRSGSVRSPAAFAEALERCLGGNLTN
jgi:eukaryotic-like serine/threonine-protein kinase